MFERTYGCTFIINIIIGVVIEAEELDSRGSVQGLCSVNSIGKINVISNYFFSSIVLSYELILYHPFSAMFTLIKRDHDIR